MSRGLGTRFPSVADTPKSWSILMVCARLVPAVKTTRVADKISLRSGRKQARMKLCALAALGVSAKARMGNAVAVNA